jgi:hypothetical protein
LQGLEQSPNAFEPNGDYVVSNQTASSYDRATHPQVGLFSEPGVQDSAFSSISIAFGGEAKNQGQAIGMQLNGQVVVGGLVENASPINDGLARFDTNGELETTFDGGGTLTLDNAVNALLIDANGNIVAVKEVRNDGDRARAVSGELTIRPIVKAGGVANANSNRHQRHPAYPLST